MHVSSALRRSRTSHGSPSGNIGSSLPKADKTAAAISCLRSTFPQGFKESMFNGTEDEIGEMHCACLKQWYVFKCRAGERSKVLSPAWAMLW